MAGLGAKECLKSSWNPIGFNRWIGTITQRALRDAGVTTATSLRALECNCFAVRGLSRFEDRSMLPFVRDGYQRACDGIRGKVEKKYAKRWKAATADGRKILIAKIEAEVREMIKRKAPPGGLY